jgi:hypothetical protein
VEHFIACALHHLLAARSDFHNTLFIVYYLKVYHRDVAGRFLNFKCGLQNVVAVNDKHDVA